MPTSAQSAVRASARLSVDGSDCDRERARPEDRDTRRVDCDQPALDHRFGRSAPIADVDPLAVEPFVVAMASQRAFGAWRGHLEVIRSVDELRVIEKWTGDSTHALAVLDCDRFSVVDRHAQRPPRLTRLLQGVELIAHVVEGG